MINLSGHTEQLALRLAAAQRVSVEQAVHSAIEARARAVGIQPDARQGGADTGERMALRRARIDVLVEELRAMPVLDPRSTHDIADELNDL